MIQNNHDKTYGNYEILSNVPSDWLVTVLPANQSSCFPDYFQYSEHYMISQVSSAILNDISWQTEG